MTRLREQVAAFHAMFGYTSNDKPTIPSADEVRRRCRLVIEEALEFVQAMVHKDSAAWWAMKYLKQRIFYVVDKMELEVDIVEVADACADIDYVVEGSRLAFGIDGDDIADEVHKANMAKLGVDGKPLKDAAGKTIKPEGWTPPDIAGCLEKQGW